MEPIQEIDILWITARLGSDGDTAITAATQPSLEEILLGGYPGIPKVDFHIPDKFMPFMNQPPGSLVPCAAVSTYGRAIALCVDLLRSL